MLVWKFPDTEVEFEGDEIKLKDTQPVHQLADMALISFLKIIAEIKKSRKLLKYREN